MKLARVRFLLADDAGAGKTIMAELLVRELKLHRSARRLRIPAPFYLRRTKEAMVYFPERQPEREMGCSHVIYQARTAHRGFQIDGEEHDLCHSSCRMRVLSAVRNIVRAREESNRGSSYSAYRLCQICA